MTTSRIPAVALALSLAFGFGGGVGSTQDSARDQKVSGTIPSSKRMADGKEWTTDNLSVNTSSSYCYDDSEPNCRRYGRLYTWESAQRGCQSLGDGWRLPTDDEWRQMAKYYGGLGNDAQTSSVLLCVNGHPDFLAGRGMVQQQVAAFRSDLD